MHRRRFVARLCATPFVGFAVVSLAGCSDERDASGRSQIRGKEDPQSIQSFAYYQGLGPAETRSPSRSDGTDSSMPCITAGDILAGAEKTYDFWHGHSRQHKFTITGESFLKLQEGQAIEIFTDVVDGHRHALAIKPTSRCTEAC